jgi:hypothetical protein
VQSTPQLIPIGAELTDPVPLPARLTLSTWVSSVNDAVTLLAWSIVTTQVPVPLQPPPLHPVKLDPTPGEAVSVTLVPWS